jgi:hypothetical protein
VDVTQSQAVTDGEHRHAGALRTPWTEQRCDEISSLGITK